MNTMLLSHLNKSRKNFLSCMNSLTADELRKKLKKVNCTRLLKLWHDHSEIAGHSHLLVLVAAVYDPAFYYTTEEMQCKGVIIDIPTTVEDPQIHIWNCKQNQAYQLQM